MFLKMRYSDDSRFIIPTRNFAAREVCMKRFTLVHLVALGLLTMTLAATAQPPAPADKPAEKTDEASIPIPPETSSVTKHDWTSGGVTIHYTATAGNLL